MVIGGTRRVRPRLATVALAAWAACAAPPARSDTLVVDPYGAGQYREIQAALDAASDGDTVLVLAGTYLIARPLDFNRLHDPDDPGGPRRKDLTLRAEGGPSVTTVRVAEPRDPQRASVVVFEKGEGPASAIEGFTLTGGTGTRWGDGYFREGGGAVVVRRGSAPVIRGCVLAGNSGKYGGAILAHEAAVRLEGCVLRENSARTGGGVCGYAAAPILDRCVLAANCALRGGGAYWERDQATLTHCTVALNSALDGGGFYLSEATVVAESCIVWGNAGGSVSAPPTALPSGWVARSCVEGGWSGDGAAAISTDPGFCGWPSDLVHVDPSFVGVGDGSPDRPFSVVSSAISPTLYELSLTPDSPCIGAGLDGSTMGAIEEACGRPRVREREIRLAPGRHEFGGARSVAGGVSLAGTDRESTVVVGTLHGLRSGTELSGVTVSGGIDAGLVVGRGESPRISDCSFTENRGHGALAYRSTAAFLRCAFRSNGGDGLACEDAGTSVSGCEASGNAGAGLSASGRCDPSCEADGPVVEGCTISENATGGVLWSSGARGALARCRIRGNRVWGALFVDRTPATLTNCLIEANGGPGVDCFGDGASPTIASSTIWGNLGDGVSALGPSFPEIASTIVWGNGAQAIRAGFGSTVSATYSCVEGEAPWPGEGNVASDPLVAEPAVWDDGGTPDVPEDDSWRPGDLRLKPGSPCIDAGTAAGTPAEDIEGLERRDDPLTRNTGGGPETYWDIGAHEFPPTSPPLFVRGDVDGDRRRSITDPVLVLRYLFLGGRDPRCLEAANVDDVDDEVTIGDAIYLLSFLFLLGDAPPEPFRGCGPDPTPGQLGCESYGACPDP